MSGVDGRLSRRRFLYRLGLTGGAGVTLGAMMALGIAPEPGKIDFRAPSQGDFTLTGRADATVLILGAGIAGLTCAYELEKAGYRCPILEARTRPGGRNWVVRGGTSETETDGIAQTCRFDQGYYLNAGPTRFPQHHTTLDYCRELKIPIHTFGNHNADAYYYFENAGPLSEQRLRQRMLQADTRGYIAELLAKALNQGALDQELTATDKVTLIDFLRTIGVLTGQDRYVGAAHRGFSSLTSAPGAGLQAGAVDKPPPFSDILSLTNADVFNLSFFFAFESSWDQAMPMFEPEGGMDSIPNALTAAIKGPIHYEAQVTRIENTANGVQVTYQDKNKSEQQMQADYCICTLPPHIVKRIPNNFSTQVNADLAVPRPTNAGKMGLQFKRRFWEEDDRIFGGITATNMDLTFMIYPSYGYLGRKGVVVGYYNFDQFADTYGVLSPEQREKRALMQGSKIHGPAYLSEFENSFSVDWRKTRFSEGAWMAWPEGTQGGADSPYGRLLQPAGQIYFAGDYLTHTIAWQHGAFESARKVVMELHDRVLKK